MMVVASGHAQVQQFVNTTRPDVRTVETWGEVLQLLPHARGLFLGERLSGRPNWEQVLPTIRSTTSQVRLMVWLSQDNGRKIFEGTDTELLTGDLTSNDLIDWLGTFSSSPTDLRLPKRWVLWRPDMSLGSGVIPQLTQLAQRHYGSGCWADLDWSVAGLTAQLCSEVWNQGDFSYEKLKVKAMPWGWMAPAPPPWSVIFHMPTTGDLNRLLKQRYEWWGLDIGANFRVPLAMSAIELASHVMVIAQGSPKILREGLQAIRMICPSVEISGIGTDPAMEATVIYAGGLWFQWHPHSPSAKKPFFRKILWRD
jgi:hypothetical protein